MGLSKQHKEWIPYYSYRVNLDPDDKIYVVSVEELPGCMTHGKTPEEAMEHAYEAVEGYMETCQDIGKEIPQPVSLIDFSGNFHVRANPQLHRDLTMKCKREGAKSFNNFVLEILQAGLNGPMMASAKHRSSKKRSARG